MFNGWVVYPVLVRVIIYYDYERWPMPSSGMYVGRDVCVRFIL